MKKKVLIQGALIVLVASIITRFAGFFFRIYIADKLGAKGMGIYQLIVSLYMLATTFTTSGISFAVSRLVSENMAKSKGKNSVYILKTAISWALFLGLLISLILIIFKNHIGEYILRDSRTIKAIFWLAPSLPFMAISSCIKGYFFAKRKPIFPASANILEQVIKMSSIIILLDSFLEKGIDYACAIISVGMTICEITSFIYMSLLLIKNKEPKLIPIQNEQKNNIFSKILKISIPVQTSNSFNAALALIESILIIETLKIYTNGNSDAATGTYGIIKGMVLPLIMFPNAFLQSIITVLIPELSGASAGGNKKAIRKACEKSLQLTIILGIFISALFIIFPNDISLAVYKNRQVAPILKSFSAICPILYLQLICMGILNAIGYQMSSMKYNIFDGVLRIALIVLFVPKGGIKAFIILMFISNISTLSLYIFKLIKTTSFPINITKLLIKPIISISFSYIISFPVINILKNIFPKWSFVIISAFLIFLIYSLFLAVFKCINMPKKSLNLKKIKING